MGYSLVPVVVDIPKLKSVMGSKDVAVLQAAIKKHRKEMLDIDAMGDYFDEFEKAIKDDYKAFIKGDFSGIDLKAVYPEPTVEEEDEETAEFRKKMEKLSPKEREKAALKFLEEAFKDADWDEDDDDDEEADDQEPVKEVTTGEALAQLILGGNTDKSSGFKYGYALRFLCEQLGTVPEHDNWCSLRSSSNADEAIDKALKKAGVPAATFSVSKFLINRGSPVSIPTPDDFPCIGYLTRDEVRTILPLIAPEKIEAVLKKSKADREWMEPMIDELRSWIELSAKTDRDLVCFYS